MLSRARADLLIRILLFVGVAIAISGILLAPKHTALGIVLGAVGFAVAISPCWISCWEDNDSQGRKETRRE